jgi:hypothetical protein
VVTANGLTDSFTTGPLPDDLLGASFTISGEAFGFDTLLMPLACATDTWFVLVDPTGRVVWYTPSPGFAGWQDGYTWSPADRTLLSIGDGAFVETDRTGAEILRLGPWIGDEQLHHDVARWNGFTYLLFEERVGSVFVDGFEVFEGTSNVGRFFLGDVFTVGAGTADWSHANSLHPNTRGEIAMSLGELDSVVLVDGDPASPGFLDVLWVASGATNPELPADYVPPAGAGEGFAYQHGASTDGDEVWLLDNRSQPTSRALRLTLDDAAGTIAVDREWPLGVSCTVQGGAIPVEGGVVVTCAPAARIDLFREDSATPSWSMTVTCGTGVDVLTRAIPVAIE